MIQFQYYQCENVLVLKSKIIPISALTSCVSQIGFSPFTTKSDVCKVSCTKCELGIAPKNNTNKLRPSSKKHAIFNKFLRQEFTKGLIIFPDRNRAELSPTGKNYKNKISNFSNFLRKFQVELYLCDSTHV